MPALQVSCIFEMKAMETKSNITLLFERGTLLLEGVCESLGSFLADLPFVAWDQRTLQWRSQGRFYKDIVLACKQKNLTLIDRARNYERLTCPLKTSITPREHQKAALSSWLAAGSQGTISLPTGSGKTILAILCIAETARPTLIVVPTIDLLEQWQSVLKKYFTLSIGILGGGVKDIQSITVATYDSALIHVEYIGHQFGLIVFDECHHLPAPHYQTIALAAIAPFRLGLSATVERADGKENVIFELIGPLVYSGDIHHMASDVLSPYDVISVQVPLNPQEQKAYEDARAIYLSFLKKSGISFSHPNGWMEFLYKASRTPEGRAAIKAYREQKLLSQASEGKIEELWNILKDHVEDRVLIFTEDNAMAYKIGRIFILPVLTHKTKMQERKRFLDSFRSGDLRVIVTSKVLNEGVDVPEANVGVVISGSGGVREHVQRLGRLLRHKPGKRAKLYEIISKGTSEFYVSKRRRRHSAYTSSKFGQTAN